MQTLAMWREQRKMLPPRSPAEEAELDRLEGLAVRKLEQYAADAVRRGTEHLDEQHAAVVAQARTVRHAMEALTEQARAGDMTAAAAGKAWNRLHGERERVAGREAALHDRLEQLRDPVENPVEYADRTMAKYNLSPFLPPLTT